MTTEVLKVLKVLKVHRSSRFTGAATLTIGRNPEDPANPEDLEDVSYYFAIGSSRTEIVLVYVLPFAVIVTR